MSCIRASDDGKGFVTIVAYLELSRFVAHHQIRLLRILGHTHDVVEKEMAHGGGTTAVELSLTTKQTDAVSPAVGLDEVRLIVDFHEGYLVTLPQMEQIAGERAQRYAAVPAQCKTTPLLAWSIEYYDFIVLLFHSLSVYGARNGSSRSRHPDCAL